MRLTTPPTPVALANPSLVTCLAISSDGTDMIVGQVADERHPALSRWSLPGLSPLPGPPCPLTGSGDTCNVLARSEDGLLAVAGLSAQQLAVLSEDTEDVQPTSVDGQVLWAELAGRLLASSGTRTEIHDLTSGRLIWRQEPPAPPAPSHTSTVPLITFRPDRQEFAVGGSGEPAVVLYPLAGAEPLTAATDPLAVLSGAPERLHWLGYGPGGKYLAAVDAYAKRTVLWRSGETEPHLPDVFGENTEDHWAIAFHPDGEHCAMGMLFGAIRIYRLSDGEMLDRQTQHLGRVNTLAFTPDGSLLLSGGDDGKLLAWPVVA